MSGSLFFCFFCKHVSYKICLYLIFFSPYCYYGIIYHTATIVWHRMASYSIRISSYTLIYHRIWSYDSICYCTSSLASHTHRIPKPTIPHNIPPVCEPWMVIPPPLGRCYMVLYGVIWCYVVLYDGIWWYMMVYDGMWCYMMAYGGIQWHRMA